MITWSTIICKIFWMCRATKDLEHVFFLALSLLEICLEYLWCGGREHRSHELRLARFTWTFRHRVAADHLRGSPFFGCQNDVMMWMSQIEAYDPFQMGEIGFFFFGRIDILAPNLFFNTPVSLHQLRLFGVYSPHLSKMKPSGNGEAPKLTLPIVCWSLLIPIAKDQYPWFAYLLRKNNNLSIWLAPGWSMSLVFFGIISRVVTWEPMRISGFHHRNGSCLTLQCTVLSLKLSTLETYLQAVALAGLLRMMRAFRVFRLFKRVESLRKIMQSLSKAVPGVANAFLIQAKLGWMEAVRVLL